MCLAEALLRIPDAATRDALIRDKIGDADWQAHLGQQPVAVRQRRDLGTAAHRQAGRDPHRAGPRERADAAARAQRRAGRCGAGVDMAMRLMGEQFVTGETIEEALAARQARAKREGFRYSYDMLGEAALTEADAQRYLRGVRPRDRRDRPRFGRPRHLRGPGHLDQALGAASALRRARSASASIDELYPRLRELARWRARTTSASTSMPRRPSGWSCRSTCSSGSASSPRSHGWHGIGFVVQAYQKRCPRGARAPDRPRAPQPAPR